jgi:hypothetical protein
MTYLFSVCAAVSDVKNPVFVQVATVLRTELSVPLHATRWMDSSDSVSSSGPPPDSVFVTSSCKSFSGYSHTALQPSIVNLLHMYIFHILRNIPFPVRMVLFLLLHLCTSSKNS